MSDITGFSFPFAIDPVSGGVSKATGADKIRQNIQALLGTRFGERVMLREYGTRIHSLVHDPNDEALSTLIRRQLQDSRETVRGGRGRRVGSDHPRQAGDADDPLSHARYHRSDL